jgi:deoxyhypusine synthase
MDWTFNDGWFSMLEYTLLRPQLASLKPAAAFCRSHSSRRHTMIQVVEFPLEAGGTVLVEVDVPDTQAARIGVSDQIRAAGESFEQSLQVLRPVAKAIMETLRELSPQEVSAEFGFKMNVEKGVIIAKAGAEANFKVTLTWKQPAATKE